MPDRGDVGDQRGRGVGISFFIGEEQFGSNDPVQREQRSAEQRKKKESCCILISITKARGGGREDSHLTDLRKKEKVVPCSCASVS